MTTVPASRPADTHAATWRDFGRLFLLGWAGVGIVLTKQRSWRWLYIGLLVVLILEMLAFGFLLNNAIIPLIFAAVIVGTTLGSLLGQTIWRLADRRRLILMPASRDCAVDVIFHADGHISLSNYTRMPSATSAPALRADIAAWLRSLPGEIRFRAQGRKIADMYIREFPGLVETGSPNRLGLIELSARNDHRGVGTGVNPA